MSETQLPQITLVRHGETAWSRSGQHTGRSDIPLTPAGEDAASTLAPRLAARTYAAVWSSPSSRAVTTCALAGFGAGRVIEPDLAEWDYGAYEGRTTKDILTERPGWRLFRDGCPGGEDAANVGARADRAIARIRALDADLILFSSAHVLRVLAARWIGLPPEGGALLVLGTASVSVLGYEHDRSEPVLRNWNG
ncbi:putative phosphoglycerate mutase [Methylobacterium brachiatum]|uniref:Phosphoglycerate mutase n=1 Tax=Methylobacterium brachiatum TaxID=269660 RepID=A0AAJ1TM44_9HYPH|nr:histidine phosphatase family protein [Methylobacterium brachiatum]MCB4802610.1 histidine phosphatase family protein [Methylobacterium brachiatum]MDQ0543236.1 putative phosphoglycerate mutase [Methylobacterium brachiatum]